MNHLYVNSLVLLSLCLLFTGMNSHAGEYSGVMTRVAQSDAGRHESGGNNAPPKSSVLCTGKLKYADESCKKNKQLLLEAVSQDGRLLEHADQSLKMDSDIVLAAVKQIGRALNDSFLLDVPALDRVIAGFLNQ